MTPGSAPPGAATPAPATVHVELASPAVAATANDAQLATTNHELENLTACEVASWLGVDRKTVYEYAARRVIPCRRLGRRFVFSRPAIRAWLAGSPSENAAPSRRLSLVR